jgi:FkbM family methyltransferase
LKSLLVSLRNKLFGTGWIDSQLRLLRVDLGTIKTQIEQVSDRIQGVERQLNEFRPLFDGIKSRRATYPLTRAVVERKLFSAEPLTLLDIGASGGIPPIWSILGSELRAFGFEPLLDECSRLNDLAPSGVEYVPAFISGPPITDVEHDAESERWDNRFVERTSAELALKLQKRTMTSYYSQENRFSDDRFTIDEFVNARQIKDVDFIKIDTDGNDLEVLLGAEKTLSRSQVLGLMVECEFHGTWGPRANTFANIDTFLRSKGFTLADLQIYRYSRAALPSTFIHNFPSGTERGQVKWADAIYLRDIAADGYAEFWNIQPSVPKLLKLACLHEMFSLEDCAAELLQRFKKTIGGSCDVDKLLNAITPELNGTKMSYDEYIAAFNSDNRDFYPRTTEA